MRIIRVTTAPFSTPRHYVVSDDYDLAGIIDEIVFDATPREAIESIELYESRAVVYASDLDGSDIELYRAEVTVLGREKPYVIFAFGNNKPPVADILAQLQPDCSNQAHSIVSMRIELIPTGGIITVS